MRPEILYPLFRPVTGLPGIGPRLAKLVTRLVRGHGGTGGGPGSGTGESIAPVADLLWHLPSGIVDRRHQPKISAAKEGELATLTVTVDAHEAPRNRRQPYKVRVRDETGFLTLVFFHAKPDYLKRVLPVGESRIVSGKVDDFGGAPQITHPDRILTAEEFATAPQVEPVYPLTAGLTARPLYKAVQAALSLAPALPEWQDAAWLRSKGWPTWREALIEAHAPEGTSDLDPSAGSRARLAYDEILANQLSLAIVRKQMKRQAARPLKTTNEIVAKILNALPYKLTGSQTQALSEIRADLEGPVRMIRLLQGDVGSGKTIVALLAMAMTAEAGAQAALMAPTEILARQHLKSIEPLARAAGLEVALLTGHDKGKVREAILARLAAGEIDILIGTHALFQEEIGFKDLALAVVDEQHRFGVHQRLALGGKGKDANLLAMTATPIPRTLTLTVYGDMDVSRLLEKPPGRSPITTRAAPLSRLDEVVEGLREPLREGRQAYWVCPLVEESDVIDAAAAEDRYRHLAQLFGEDRVGLVHGRLPAAEKERTMTAFAAGELQLLVATTVIEVGVDVPNATIMLIEQAERFGLAQLHQLRGRVGRGQKASSCLLLYQPPLGEAAQARLKILRETEDGFRIAEEDLRLRGAGELLGTRQSGLPVFRLARLDAHGDLIEAARDDAAMIAERDPGLTTARGKALRTLLYLFEQDQAVRTLQSG